MTCTQMYMCGVIDQKARFPMYGDRVVEMLAPDSVTNHRATGHVLGGSDSLTEGPVEYVRSASKPERRAQRSRLCTLRI